jgi:hypothetical protein
MVVKQDITTDLVGAAMPEWCQPNTVTRYPNGRFKVAWHCSCHKNLSYVKAKPPTGCDAIAYVKEAVEAHLQSDGHCQASGEPEEEGSQGWNVPDLLRRLKAANAQLRGGLKRGREVLLALTKPQPTSAAQLSRMMAPRGCSRSTTPMSSLVGEGSRR